MSLDVASTTLEAGAAKAARPDGGIGLAQAVIGALQRTGVREVVVCAGARNAALVAVLAKSKSLRLWSFAEERCAGFFALGRCRALDAPVAVLTTSGTAVAELLPSVIEAYYQAVPLVLVTADRPRRFRGSGAPQAIEQTGIFSSYVAAAGDIASADELAAFEPTLAAWDWRRPVQINVCLDEPSAYDLAGAEAVVAQRGKAPVVPRSAVHPVESFLADSNSGPLVVVVAALPEREQSSVASFLRRLGCPVIAEATSGLREHPEVVDLRVEVSETALARLPVGRVLRLGAVPSSRWWRDLENREVVRVMSLTPSGFSGLARPSLVCGFPEWDQVMVPAHQPSPLWKLEDESRIDTELQTYARSEPALVHALSSAIPNRALVFLGNSLPIREWNVFATNENRGLRCHANRGANGIDGCVSTFLGLAADEAESWAVVGDLTALYDLAALWITPALPPARRRIALINNGGGRIFARVAALRGLDPEPRRLMENPHVLEFSAWAGMFGWAYARATTATEIAAAAARSELNLIVEIVPDEAATVAAWAHFTRNPA